MMFGRSHPVLEAGRILQYEHSQNTRADITWTERKVSFSSHSYTNWESLSPFPFWSLQSFQDCEFRGFLPDPDIVSISSLTEGYIFSLYIYICNTHMGTFRVSVSGLEKFQTYATLTVNLKNLRYVGYQLCAI